MTKYRYTEEQLRSAVSQAISMREVLRILDTRFAGGTYSHIKRRIISLGIDISHFCGHASNIGNRFGGSRIRTADEILVFRSEEMGREKAHKLRRALKERGIEEICVECGTGVIYNTKPLVLHVDHIDGNFLDCRQENLRFLCPNCHQQTPSFGIKNRKFRLEIEAVG